MTGESVSHFRRKSRALAVQALYEMDIAGHSSESSFSWLVYENDVPKESVDYALELAKGVADRLGEIDRRIRQHAPLWPVNQLPVVDRNILRQAILEILFVQGVPTKVVINEAIELAKTFGSESSPRFVNGVLGSLVDESQKAKDVELEPAIATAENHIQEGS